MRISVSVVASSTADGRVSRSCSDEMTCKTVGTYLQIKHVGLAFSLPRSSFVGVMFDKVSVSICIVSVSAETRDDQCSALDHRATQIISGAPCQWRT